MSTDGKQRIKPFQKLSLEMLPTKELKNAFKLQWKPIFAFLSDVANFPPPGETTSNEQINKAYSRCLEHLKSTVSYCFQKKKNPEDQWTIATWSVRTARSSIEKNGTESDKAKLPPSSNRNKARNKGLQRKRKDSANPLYLRRQQQRQQRRRELNNAPPRNGLHQRQRSTTRRVVVQEDNAFANAFPTFELTEQEMQEQSGEIERQVAAEIAEEMKQDLAERARERATEGDTVATDGTLLFTGRRTGIQAPNVGDNSRVARERYTNSLEHLTNACQIAGCAGGPNRPGHHCYNCRALVHNLCAQGNGLCSDDNELNMYCSQQCKQQKEG